MLAKVCLAMILCFAAICSPTLADDEINFEAEIKICEKYNIDQIHNCEAINVVPAADTSKLINIAVHTRITWNSDRRRSVDLFITWLFRESDGEDTVRKHPNDYDDMSFTPSTVSKIFEHSFTGRIWQDEVGIYTIVLHHDVNDYINSELSRIKFEVK